MATESLALRLTTDDPGAVFNDVERYNRPLL